MQLRLEEYTNQNVHSDSFSLEGDILDDFYLI